MNGQAFHIEMAKLVKAALQSGEVTAPELVFALEFEKANVIQVVRQKIAEAQKRQVPTILPANGVRFPTGRHD